MHFLGIIQVFTEIGTDNVLVPHLETKCRLSGNSFYPGIDIRAQHAGSVVVVFDNIRFSPDEFEPVLSPVPIQCRLDLDKTAGLRLHGSKGLERVLELVIKLGAVESVGTEVPGA